MKLKSLATLLLLFTLLICSGVTQAQTDAGIADQAGETTTYADVITVNPNGRPLAPALIQLERIYGLPITYEDTRYIYEGENREVTFNNQAHKTMRLKDRLSFRYVAAPQGATLDVRKKLAADALNEAVRSYNSAYGEEVFSITETDDGFHVVARKFKNNFGSVQNLDALLDTPVTITPGTRTVNEVLAEICKQIPTLSLGPFPYNLFTQHETTLAADKEPARSVIDRLIKEVPVWAEVQVGPGQFKDTKEGGYISWQLRTDPDPKWGSALSFYIVKPPGTV